MQVVSYGEKSPKVSNRSQGNRIACVICTYLPQGLESTYTIKDWEGTREQYITESKLDTLRFALACYEHYNPGIEFDLHLVDNSSPAKLPKVKYPIHKRENKGLSFGAFKWFWENHKDYDYYFFHEMDIVPAKDGWLSEILDVFLSDPQIGIVGNYLETRDETPMYDYQKELIRSKRKVLYSPDGAFHFTSRNILEQVTLPDVTDWGVDAWWNELAFEQPILDLGYKMVTIADKDRLYSYGHRFLSLDPEVENLTLDKITPTIHAQLRLTQPKFKKYFSFYEPKA